MILTQWVDKRFNDILIVVADEGDTVIFVYPNALKTRYCMSKTLLNRDYVNVL